jgi:hypothetical protein
MTHIFQKASRSMVFSAPMSFLKNQDFGSLGILKKSLSDVFGSLYIFGSLGKDKDSSSRCCFRHRPPKARTILKILKKSLHKKCRRNSVWRHSLIITLTSSYCAYGNHRKWLSYCNSGNYRESPGCSNYSRLASGVTRILT